MATPVVVEIDGSGPYARTWVAEICFKEIPDATTMPNLMANLAEKPYHIGVFQMSPMKVLMVMRGISENGQISNSHCKTLLLTMFKRARVDATVGQLTTLTGYHLELFGFKAVPMPSQPLKATPVTEEVTHEEEDELHGLTADVDNMADFRRVTEEYFAKREKDLLAVRSESFHGDDAPTIRLQWITTPPPQIEVVTKRNLREWQKLEWVLFRDGVINGDDGMMKAPTAGHWPSFYSLYSDISSVSEARHRLREAFKTFAGHVHATTGRTINRTDLPTEDANKLHSDGRCFQCGSSIPLSLEMAGQINTNLGQVVCRAIDDAKVVEDASRFGVFCSRRCVRGRCHGCAGALVDGKCPNECGDDQMGNRRRVVPLGYGTNGDMSDEYVKPMDFNFAKRGLPLTWPMCQAKKKCRFHTCLHVCERDCAHECRGCRQCNGTVKFGAPGCECDPLWLQYQHPDDIAPNYDVQDEIYKMVNTIHMQPERPSKKPRT